MAIHEIMVFMRGGTLFSQASKMLKSGNNFLRQGVKALMPTSKVMSYSD